MGGFGVHTKTPLYSNWLYEWYKMWVVIPPTLPGCTSQILKEMA